MTFSTQLTQAKVWVAYALPEQQFHLEVDYVVGMTAEDAILNSGINALVVLPEQYSLGIFGTKIKDKNQVLQPGDRVEIYRALTINPKEIRRNRAAANPVGNYCRSNRFK